MKDNECIDDQSEYVITKINGTCCLKIRRAAPEHSAKYTCIATNDRGSASSSSTVRVFRKFHFLKCTLTPILSKIIFLEKQCLKLLISVLLLFTLPLSNFII